MRTLSLLCILSALALAAPTVHAQIANPDPLNGIKDNVPLVGTVEDTAFSAQQDLLRDFHFNIGGVFQLHCVSDGQGGMKCLGLLCIEDPVHKSLPISFGGSSYFGVGVGPPDNKGLTSYGPYEGAFVSPSGTGCTGG